MKIGCIVLNSNLIACDKQTSIIKYLTNNLYEIGESISLISYFDNSLEKLKNVYSEKPDILFVIGTDDVIYNHNIKDNLARISGEKLEANQNALMSLKKYCEKYNINFSMQEDMEVLLPTNSIALTYDDTYSSGFVSKSGNTYMIFLPNDIEFVKYNYNQYILPLINDLVSSTCKTQVIKVFGILEKDIKNFLSEYYGIDGLTITIVGDWLDNTIFVRSISTLDENKSRDVISGIISKLNKFIYSLENVSIYKMAVDMLKIQHKTITIGDTITYGNITNRIAEIDPSVITSSSIYTSFEKIKLDLSIDTNTIKDYGEYSVNTIYECANSLLSKSTGDIALFVLGSKATDTCFVAVGDLDGIHVYKNKINIKNSDLQENLSKTAMFYLIKKLKQNDLCFWKNSV